MKKQIGNSFVQQLFSGRKFSAGKYRLLFFLLGVLFYSNTVPNGYSLDDSLVVEGHGSVAKGFAGIPEILSSPYQNDEEQSGEYRPVAIVSFAIEYEFFGANTVINHFFNAVLYGVVCLLVFSLWLRLFGMAYFEWVFVGSLIFAIHPIHTEVVASLKNRENILSLLFGLAACRFFLRYFDSRNFFWLAATWIFFLLSLLSKIDGVVFAGIIALMAFYKGESYKRIGIVVFVMVALYFGLKLSMHHFLPPAFRNNYIYENPLFGEVSFVGKIAFAMATLFHYFRLLLFPYPLKFYYGYNLIPIPHLTELLPWFSLLLHFALLGYAVKGLFKKSFFAFAILWYLVSIAIFSQLAEPVMGIIGERHTFIASVGFAMGLSCCLMALFGILQAKIGNRQAGTVKAITFAGLVLLCFFYVVERNKDWKDGDTLIDNDIHKLENSAYAHFEYGNNLIRRADKTNIEEKFNGFVNKASTEYQKAAKVYPRFAFAWYNTAMCYLRLDSPKIADGYFRKAWELDTVFRSTNYFLGLQAAERKDTAAAIDFYERELRYKPENVRAIERLYNLCVFSGQPQRALNNFLIISAKNAQNPRVYTALGNLYLMKSDTATATQYYRIAEAKALKPPPEFFW